MSIETTYEFLILLLIAVLALEIIARKFSLPPAAAFIVGGLVLALTPGLPAIDIDPGLIMVVFLPPLLMSAAYFTVWREFKRHFGGITSLAVGAVAFTTLVVGVLFHALFPQFPFAVGFALGAIVSPPDAVSAGAILDKLHLPSRITAILEGESLVNDSSGLVLLRFAVAAALTGSFSVWEAFGGFVWVTGGGILTGLLLGWIGLLIIRRLSDSDLIITSTLLLAAVSYILAERFGGSGVLSTVTTGLMLGWHQHETFSAATRVRAQAFWQSMIFLLESLLFILIGLSLRGVLHRIGDMGHLAVPIAAIVAAVVTARFVWMLSAMAVISLASRKGQSTEQRPTIAGSVIMSWAGMRGVVTLTGALSLPASMPGRDIILVTAFTVIIVTVLVQGTTLGPLANLLGFANTDEERSIRDNESAAWKRVADAQYRAVQALSSGRGSEDIHPRLLEQYRHRAQVAAQYQSDPAAHDPIKADHFKAVLSAIHAGRQEILRMHRAGEIHDRVMRHLEHELDLQELAAENRK